MSRGILLPSSGNIFSDHYQWNIIKKYIYDTFDIFYVFINSPDLDEELLEDYKKLYNDRKTIVLTPVSYYTGHINAMHTLMRENKTDMICFFESDFLVFEPSIINSAFKKIEQKEVSYVGMPRGFCSYEILQTFRNRYKDMRFIYEDGSTWKFPEITKWPAELIWFAWWPCGFYADAKILNDSSYFIYPKIEIGEEVPPLKGYFCKEQMYYDTFGYAGLLLFDQKYKFDIQNLDQYEEDSPKSSALHLMVNADHLSKLKYRSVHWCNSSAWLHTHIMTNQHASLNEMKHHEINEANALKNYSLTKAYLDVYPLKHTSFFKKMNARFEFHLRFLEEHNNEIVDNARNKNIPLDYYTTREKVDEISNIYRRILESKL